MKEVEFSSIPLLKDYQDNKNKYSKEIVNAKGDITILNKLENKEYRTIYNRRISFIFNRYFKSI